MKVQVRKLSQRVSLIKPEGRIDAVSGPHFRHLLRHHPSWETPFVIIDLHKVTFMDSSGLSALVAGLKAAREHQGMIFLVRPTPQVRTTLHMSMLDRIFPIYDDVEEALEVASSLIASVSSLVPAI